VDDKSNSGPASTSPSSTNPTSYAGTEALGTPTTAPDLAREASLDDAPIGVSPVLEAELPSVAKIPSPVLGPKWPLPPIPFGVSRERQVSANPSKVLQPGISLGQSHNTSPSSPPISLSFSPPTASQPKPSRPVRTIDRNQLVETFSVQDIADIKHAAECLSMFCCNREAFELFTTILKRQLSDDACRDNTFWYLVIQCAHTASIPEHVEIIQNIIRAELARLQGPPSDPVSAGNPATENMLLHMLLAFTSRRSSDVEEVDLEIFKARAYLLREGLPLISKHLAPEHRSLDLAVYRNLLRLHATEACDLKTPVPFEFAPFGLGRLEYKMPLEDWILSRTPGPFELQKDGHMANPCIRSCISWCERTLLLLRSIPITPGIMGLCKDKAGRAWAEANALFIALWEHWVTYYTPTSSSSPGAMWMTETQEKMGISSTELLLLVCRAIHNSYYPWNTPARSEEELIRRLRKKTDELAEETDIKLARRILKQYISRNTVTMWPTWRSVVQRLEKARMMDCFENVLLVRFPRLGVTRDLISSVLIPPGAAPGEDSALLMFEEPSAFPAVDKAEQLSPTLASSNKSADYSAFRKTGISVFLRLARGSLPASSRSRSGTGSGYPSDISMSLASMSISGDSVTKRRASSQVISATGVGVDGVLGQASEGREVDSDRRSVVTWI